MRYFGLKFSKISPLPFRPLFQISGSAAVVFAILHFVQRNHESAQTNAECSAVAPLRLLSKNTANSEREITKKITKI